MTLPRLPIVNDTLTNYYDGVESQIWLYAQNLTQSSPSVARMLLLVATAAVVGATTIALTVPVSSALVKGYRITNGIAATPGTVEVPATATFELTTDAAIGDTVLNVAPLLSPIAANATFSAVPMIPFYSVAETGIKPSGDTTTIRNYGAPVNEINKRHKTKIEVSLKGFVTKGDAALKTIRRGLRGGGVVYVRSIAPDEEAVEGYFEVTGGDIGMSVDKDYENSFTLMPASAISYPNLVLV